MGILCYSQQDAFFVDYFNIEINVRITVLTVKFCKETKE